MDTNQYTHGRSFDLVRCVQIESTEAVYNLEQMAKIPWVDCFIFGPCDLSGTVGQLDKVMGRSTQDLIKRAIAILTGANKSIGVSLEAIDRETIEFWHE